MPRLRDLPIKHKLTLIGLLTTGTALLLACAAFVAFDRVSFRKTLVRDLSDTAQMIGYNSAASLSFNESSSAETTLQSLAAQPHIIAACIYDPRNNVFASYRRAGSVPAPWPVPLPDHEQFTRDTLDLFRNITFSGEKIGTIYLQSDLSEIHARWLRYAGVSGGVLLMATLVALILVSRLQRIISVPVSHLATVADRVATEKNYALRATKYGDDELGRLIDGFNEMLVQIQTRDAELEGSRLELEHRVEARTKELAKSLSLLNATLESNTDGIVAVDLAGKVVTCNAKFKAIWRFPSDLLERGDAEALRAYSAEQTLHPDRFVRRTKELQATPEAEAVDTVELKDGRTFERYVFPQKIEGKCVGTVINWRDITERKQAEAAIAYERDQLRALLDSSPDLIYFKDRDSRFVLISKSKAQLMLTNVPGLRERLFGPGADPSAPVDPALFVGLSDAETYTDEHTQRALADEREIMRTGRPLVDKSEKQIFLDGTESWFLTNKMPWRAKDGSIIGTFGISKNITELKQAEERLETLHQQLIDASRKAGMAEIATGVLHNVGNVLNSVNVSATQVADHVRRSKSANIAKICELLDQHRADLGAFLTTDPKGKIIPAYLGTLAASLAGEQAAVLEELEQLRKNIEHIKDIVAMQQNYARNSSFKETVSVPELIEDSLRMNAGSMARHDVNLVRDYQARPVVTLDKHKVIQILVNFLRNAKHACDDSGRSDKQITVRVTADDHYAWISVSDNGVGIPPENLMRIFNHGFTTRKTGHGFGLHSGALAAKELGGEITVHSDGPGTGATFTLRLPINPETTSHEPHLS